MPHEKPSVAQTIRASGRRLTIQRARILDALHRLPGHSTAEQIHDMVSVRERDAEMALSTVYRNLDALVAMGLVTAFANGSGATTYEWAGDETPHHHLLCDGCGHSQEVELPSLGTLTAEVEREHGFAVDLRHLAITGTCARCQHASDEQSGNEMHP